MRAVSRSVAEGSFMHRNLADGTLALVTPDLLAAARRSLPPPLQTIASMSHCRMGQQIGGAAGLAEGWYSIAAGAARRCAVQPDGKRQILDLLLPGDFFGCIPEDVHNCTIEAIADGTIVAFYSRQQVYRLAESDSRALREICEASLHAADRLHQHMLVLGRTTTRDKVGSFLLWLAERLSGAAANKLLLPISRYDIADYLAISVETVSRSLTRLKRSGAISLNGTRRVRIHDPDALEEGRSEAQAVAVGEAQGKFARLSDHRKASLSAHPPVRFGAFGARPIAPMGNKPR
jgi:CRP-like cAMP-binding protein